MKEEVFKFLSSKTPKLCVLATASNEAKPQCAVMGYTLTPNLEVILSTDSTSRKLRLSILYAMGLVNPATSIISEFATGYKDNTIRLVKTKLNTKLLAG